PDDPQFPTAQVGESIFVLGTNLAHAGVLAVIHDPKAEDPANNKVAELLPVGDRSDKRLQFILAPDTRWVTGQLSLALEFPLPEQAFVEPPDPPPATQPRIGSSNTIALVVSPRIQGAPDVDGPLTGPKTVTVRVVDPIQERQRIDLVLNHID